MAPISSVPKENYENGCIHSIIQKRLKNYLQKEFSICWERIVGSIRTALKITLKTTKPKEEVLQTLSAEAENTVNCRPLTHVSVDSNDFVDITPHHFLL